MTPTGKFALLGGLGLTAAGLAYYFFVYRKNQANANAAIANITSGVKAAQSNVLFSAVTASDLKSKLWLNSLGYEVGSALRDYDPTTGVVSHTSSEWKGTLLDPQTIQWTTTAGRSDIWKGYPKATVFPSVKTLQAGVNDIFPGSVVSNYNQAKGTFNIGAGVWTVVSTEPIVIKHIAKSISLEVITFKISKVYASQHPELAGLGCSPTLLR